MFLMALLKLELDLSRPQRLTTCPWSNRPQLELAINLITVLARAGEVTDRTEMPFATMHESAVGVRRAKAALSSGCKPHPATAPAGSNRSSHGGNEVAEAFD